VSGPCSARPEEEQQQEEKKQHQKIYFPEGGDLSGEKNE
jgi:hypothetical protein